MPQVSKTAENEKFATLILELLDTQKQIIQKLADIEAKVDGKIAEDDGSAWDSL